MSRASLLQRFIAASRAAAKRSFAASAPEAGVQNLLVIPLSLQGRSLSTKQGAYFSLLPDQINHFNYLSEAGL